MKVPPLTGFFCTPLILRMAAFVVEIVIATIPGDITQALSDEMVTCGMTVAFVMLAIDVRQIRHSANDANFLMFLYSFILNQLLINLSYIPMKIRK
jgi:hypothetical protein